MKKIFILMCATGMFFASNARNTETLIFAEDSDTLILVSGNTDAKNSYISSKDAGKSPAFTKKITANEITEPEEILQKKEEKFLPVQQKPEPALSPEIQRQLDLKKQAEIKEEKLLKTGVLYAGMNEPLKASSVNAVIGDALQNPIIAGRFGASFQYSNTQNTASFSDSYHYSAKTVHTNDVFYKITLTCPMTVIASHCGSALSDTYLFLQDANGNFIEKNDDYTGEGQCSNVWHSYLKKNLNVGVYYVVSEGYSSNGSITTKITGTPIPVGDAQECPINIGSYDYNFQYSNTQNTSGFHDFYHYSDKAYRTNDMFYKITITKKNADNRQALRLGAVGHVSVSVRCFWKLHRQK
ncbi:MAG: hypothetical protein LBG92_09350 [Prevotellaceae bacterium]|jgi:hypothetical protein|nr:hypothetical protein [Prevotellaceae bacterium]